MQVVDTSAFISLAVGDVFEWILDEFDLGTSSRLHPTPSQWNNHIVIH
jgi:hypothetical protein